MLDRGFFSCLFPSAASPGASISNELTPRSIMPRLVKSNWHANAPGPVATTRGKGEMVSELLWKLQQEQ